MGVLKFQVNSPDPASRLPDLRKAYLTGLDRTPGRLSVEFRQGVMNCHRDTGESGRLFVPWPVERHGTPIVGTATLAERRAPYNLPVELARGKLNEVRNQLAEWRLMGLRIPAELETSLRQSQTAFVQAATKGNDLPASYAAAQASLSAAFTAGDLLAEAYTAQVIHTRLASGSKLSTQLAMSVEGDPKQNPPPPDWSSAFNAARVSVPWKALAPAEGQYRWDEFDAQLARTQAAVISLDAPRSRSGHSWTSVPRRSPTGSGSGRGISRRSSAWWSTTYARRSPATGARSRSGT